MTKNSEGGDGIEVGSGFAESAERMSGDDNRPKQAAEEPADDEDTVDSDAEDGDDNSSGADDDSDGDNGGEDADPAESDETAATRKRKNDTADYIRELKRGRREDKRQIAEMNARLAAVENRGSTNNFQSDTPTDTSEKPDANNATKYPLGVLDDGYIHDMIEWTADAKVAAAINGRLQTERESAETARVQEHMTQLRTKVDDLAAVGSDLFDDFEETVLESGLRGDWQLTETTFTAAAKRPHGAEILYTLANDRKEAARVAKLPVDEQVEYVLEKNRELADKRKARRKPQAGDPPSNLPRGRNSSSPIRPDTDNLDDFRKVWYK